MVGKREKRFCPKNVRLALTKMRVLGIREPTVFMHVEERPGFTWVSYSQAPLLIQREHWAFVLDALREYKAKANAKKWEEKNRERT